MIADSKFVNRTHGLNRGTGSASESSETEFEYKCVPKQSLGARNQIANFAKSLNDKKKGAFVSESALHFDGDKPNSVPEFLQGMIIYLTPLVRDAR